MTKSSPPTMLGVADCQYCGKRPARFRVKHAETSRHWRCLGCLRELIREGPIVVSGVVISGVLYEHAVSHLDEAHAASMVLPKAGET